MIAVLPLATLLRLVRCSPPAGSTGGTVVPPLAAFPATTPPPPASIEVAPPPAATPAAVAIGSAAPTAAMAAAAANQKRTPTCHRSCYVILAAAAAPPRQLQQRRWPVAAVGPVRSVTADLSTRHTPAVDLSAEEHSCQHERTRHHPEYTLPAVVCPAIFVPPPSTRSFCGLPLPLRFACPYRLSGCLLSPPLLSPPLTSSRLLSLPSASPSREQKRRKWGRG